MPAKTQTKPVRIFEADDRALNLIASVERRSKSEVVRSALREYMQNHRAELEDLLHQTKEAIAAGDVERLLQLSSPGRVAVVDAAMSEIDAVR